MPVVAQLTITLDDKGALSVSGPIDQLMLCFGLLELAKDSIRQAAAEKQHRVQAPNLADLAALTRRP